MSVELKRSKNHATRDLYQNVKTLRILIPKYNQSTVDQEKKVDITQRHH